MWYCRWEPNIPARLIPRRCGFSFSWRTVRTILFAWRPPLFVMRLVIPRWCRNGRFFRVTVLKLLPQKVIFKILFGTLPKFRRVVIRGYPVRRFRSRWVRVRLTWRVRGLSELWVTPRRLLTLILLPFLKIRFIPQKRRFWVGVNPLMVYDRRTCDCRRLRFGLILRLIKPPFRRPFPRQSSFQKIFLVVLRRRGGAIISVPPFSAIIPVILIFLVTPIRRPGWLSLILIPLKRLPVTSCVFMVNLIPFTLKRGRRRRKRVLTFAVNRSLGKRGS